MCRNGRKLKNFDINMYLDIIENSDFLRPSEKKKFHKKFMEELENGAYDHYFAEPKNELEFIIKTEKVYAAQRPRKGRVGIYAPDAKNKDKITELVKEIIKEKYSDTDYMTYTDIEVEITAYIRHVPKNKFEKLLGIMGITPVKKKPDLDNIAKIYLDACNGLLWYDDADITKLTLSKVYNNEEYLKMKIIYK